MIPNNRPDELAGLLLELTARAIQGLIWGWVSYGVLILGLGLTFGVLILGLGLTLGFDFGGTRGAEPPRVRKVPLGCNGRPLRAV